MACLLVIVGVESSLSQPMTVIPRGVLSAGVVGQQNYSVQFYLDRPGHLSGSWMSDVMGPPSTAYLFSSADCRVVSSTLNDVECAGSPLWRGQPDVTTYDSLNYTAGAGTYDVVWVAPDSTSSPYIIVWTPIVLDPTPWWWL